MIYHLSHTSSNKMKINQSSKIRRNQYKPVISPSFVGAEFVSESIARRYFSFFTNQWVLATAFAILIIVGILIIVFAVLQIAWFAPSSNNYLLSTDLTATCLSDNIDKGKQNLKLTYYNTRWCTNQCINYSPGFRAFDTSSKFPCPGVQSTELGYRSGPYAGLLYSKPDVSIIQDLKRSFTVSFWLGLPTYQSSQWLAFGIICAMNNPTIPTFGENTPKTQTPLTKWGIRAAPTYGQERVVFWHFNNGDNQFVASSLPVPLPGYTMSHIIFQWNAVTITGTLYLNGGESTTSFSPTKAAIITYLTSPQVTYFSIGCGAPVLGQISNLQILDSLPDPSTLYNAALGCKKSINVDVPFSADTLTCPAPDSFTLYDNNGLTGIYPSSSSAGSSSSTNSSFSSSSSSSS